MKTKKNIQRKIYFTGILLVSILFSNGQLLTTTTNNSTTVPLIVHGAVYLGHGGHPSWLNTAIGEGSLSSLTSATDPYGNTALGYNAIHNSIKGRCNAAMGTQAMEFALGSSNVAIGWLALQSGTTTSPKDTGNYNTAVGFGSMRYVQDGNYNCALGAGGALAYNPSGNYNTALGYGALGSLTSGDNNVGIGQSASVANGSNQLSIQNVIYGINMNATNTGNIGIGVSSPTEQFHTTRRVRFQGLTTSPGGASAITRLVGADASGVLWASSLPVLCLTQNKIPRVLNTNGDMTCSQIYDNNVSVGIGNVFNSGSSFAYSTGSGQWIHGITTPTPPTGTVRLSVDGVTQSLAYYAYSDKRLKKNIQPLKNMIDIIKKLNPVTYEWDRNSRNGKDLNDIPQVGFIAQEIEKIIPEAVIKDNEGYYSMNYSTIIPVVAQGIKEQQSQIEVQQIRIEDLEAKVKELSNKLNQLVPGEVKIKEANFDITPNPITGVSTVSYKLDNTNATSYLAVYDLQGKLLKQISLAKNINEGQVQIRKTDFGNGMYILSLISNNAEIQSKKFIISQ